MQRRTSVTTLAILAALVLPHGAVQGAGTAFGVDTAEVSDPGNCKVEAWASFAANGDRLGTVNPACVIQLFTPTEISAQVVRARDAGDWTTAITPKAKAKVLPTAIGSFGFAIATGGSYDATANELSTVFAYIPATLRFSETVRLNLNGGWLHDRPADRHFATWGVGFDFKLTETVILTIETFGQLGPHDPGSRETDPRFQTGLRWRPIDEFSFDLIYGRNINGEDSNWITAGTTIRFPAK